MGGVDLKTPFKDFDLAIGGGLGWLKWLKNGAGKDSCRYSCTISFSVKLLLVKLKYFYNSVYLLLNHENAK